MITVARALEVAEEACKKVNYERRSLTWALRVVHLINWINFEVTLGGVYGWLINMGEFGPDTVTALEAVGAHKCAAIVREILAPFPNGLPSHDDRERVHQMECIGEDGEKCWRELGNRLLTWPDDINVLLQKFIDEHEADFT